jgi:subtilisin family serine protease
VKQRLALAAAFLALLVPTTAQAARFAVGFDSRADLEAVRTELAARGLGRGESLAPLPAVVVNARRAAALRGLPGAAYVERLGERRTAFTPNDPLVPRQWYLTQNRAYDAWPEQPAFLAGTLVAVIDSGIDGGHPELAPRIAEAKSFVGGHATIDKQGHGTFVAGLIAAESDNAVGIAGLAPAAQLLVAKVVTADRTIPVEAEAKAIRWAVAKGARVINMSLGGVRDPLDPSVDTYSPLEAAAIAYAVRHDVVVVAAVGNADQAPSSPWRYASYPAALPHVLGVSALAHSGASPPFSNRDPIYNDIAAPGEDILSTFPRQLTADYPSCPEQGYSSCGPEEYRSAEGTSFAAPQVSAAAATLLGARPDLHAEQVTALLEQTAVDVNAARGCKGCPLGRDRFTGWGRVDVTSAIENLTGQLPPRDRYEPNDEAGNRATRIYGRSRRLEATLDYWDDQQDVYAVRLHKGQRMYAGLIGPPRTDVNLVLWRPGTREVDDLRLQRMRVRQSARPGPREYLAYRAKRTGLYYLQVKMASAGSGSYRLTVVKT